MKVEKFIKLLFKKTKKQNKESNSGLPLPHRRPPSGKSRSCYRHQPPFAAIQEISELTKMHVQNVTGAG